MPVSQQRNAVVGVVLAGGLSSRLGRDKARLALASAPPACPAQQTVANGGAGEIPGPASLLARSLSLLATVCEEFMVVGREVDGCACCRDLWPGRGPVGGVATALKVTERPCLILSCDLPFMQGPLLERLLDAREGRPDGSLCTLYKQVETGHVEALVAVYEPDALPFFLESLETGRGKISLVVPEHRRHYLPYAASEALPFFNINYPADLEAARLILKAGLVR